MTPPRLLLNGIDTLECAYYLRRAPGEQEERMDFESLLLQREDLRQQKSKEPKTITIAGVEFLLHPYGSASGYPLVLTNRDLHIQMGEYNVPSFFVRFSSEALWREGAWTLHNRFMDWVIAAGLRAYKAEGLSRVDWAFDYQLPEIDFDEDSFVSMSAKDAHHREDRKAQTFMFGKGDVVLRVYDKIAEILQQSDKVWLFQLWGGVTEDVWRVEWQARKELLRRFGIRTFTDLRDLQGDALRYLATEHDTLRLPGEDTNRSRWPLHPLWIDLQARIDAMECQGVERVIDEGAVLSERMMRMAISVYGYLKRSAAISRLRHGEDFISMDEALAYLQKFMDRVHDPLTWRSDVDKRVEAMRLGQW